MMKDQGLYQQSYEHDACGVGLVADLQNRPSHQIVEYGLEVLKRLMHRGASGSDPESGDGGGLLFALPDAFFRARIANLPTAGQYGVGMLFGGVGQEGEIERIIAREGGELFAWRDVPIDPSAIGETARKSCPRIRQFFVKQTTERQLFIIRRCLERETTGGYFCSLSTRTIVYKGLLLATQLAPFYLDLQRADFMTTVALVHQRYSTNTFPAWELAHPFRYLAHNGEINTLRGNLNALRGREPHLHSTLIGNDLQKVLPLIPAGQSDSASLDNMFELLVQAGRSPMHALLMLLPQPWGAKYHMGQDVRAFFEYHAAVMEPWDGPATVAFTDGCVAGAVLDRNGLRPARYTLTREGLFVLASETGVLELPAAEVARKGRLHPGGALMLDLVNHRLLTDTEVKTQLARQRPYRRWIHDNRIHINGFFSEIVPTQPTADLATRQKHFGYTPPTALALLKTMAQSGAEPILSMGDDTAPAIFAEAPHPFFDYFKQSFAQVTNPPIDPIREALVMSLTTYIGNLANILEESPEHAHILKLDRPILTHDELLRLQHVAGKRFTATTLPMVWQAGGTGKELQAALTHLATTAITAAHNGTQVIILSDRTIPEGSLALPSLLAVAAVHQALSREGLRAEIGLIVETDEAYEVMHMALLLGYGATAVAPTLALESLPALLPDVDPVESTANYIHALCKGLLKILSKMGISTLRSYRDGRHFQALGLSREVIDAYFPETPTPIGGLTFDELAAEITLRWNATPTLPKHFWTPQLRMLLQQAITNKDLARFKAYCTQAATQRMTVRDYLDFKPMRSIAVDEVESVDAILTHFTSGAMSLGAISEQAHEAIALALNEVHARSNCGEGGEDPARDHSPAHSAIRQVASGRFGVTLEYLRHADELQIKMAQGAKPGEGGQLPAHKVEGLVAKLRHATPHTALISPPPHHDIYSIEDLAQLIYDLRCTNPHAQVSVKLAAECGIGTIAAGVAKAHADCIVISGGDGGTGAAPLSGLHHAGLPWEIALAETQQTLQLNGLRDRVTLHVDGRIATPRDVVVAALLGAEGFGLSTLLLIALGCIMDRRCHCNTCPAGIATQDPQCQRRFHGRAEDIVTMLRFFAQEIREELARLGLHSLHEACGRVDLLQAAPHTAPRTSHLNFSRLLHQCLGAKSCAHEAQTPVESFDTKVLIPAIDWTNTPNVELTQRINNADRCIGTALSGEVLDHVGAKGLAEDSIRIHLLGTAGQSLGAFLAPGITLDVQGEANDFVGKGLSGGTIILRPPHDAAYTAQHNVIAGNVIAYGATTGKVFIAGCVGERFGVRNSGATLVAEGTGDHACEYMTAGRVVILGKTGVNFAAGMTGGIAYVYDELGTLDLNTNLDSVDLEMITEGSSEAHELLALLQQHIHATASAKAQEVVTHWVDTRPMWVCVKPHRFD